MSTADCIPRRTFALLVLLAFAMLWSRTSPAQGQQATHHWGGFVADSFILDEAGVRRTWTAEDRRIRYRAGSTAPWTYQDLPSDVEGIIRRVHFLPTNGAGQTIGFAVSSDGFVLESLDGGVTWQVQMHIMEATGPADLQDIHFLTPTEGWMVSLKQIYRWNQATTSWDVLSVSFPYTTDPEYYALDAITLANGDRLALISAEPGIVLRAQGILGGANYDLSQWTVVVDTREMCGPSTHLKPAGTPICCQVDNLCVTGGPRLELWDVELRRDGSMGAVVVGGLGQQCGAVFVSDDVMMGMAAGFVLEQHECTLNLATCLAATGPAYYCSPVACRQMLGFPATSVPQRLCRMPTLYGVAILQDGTIVATGYNGSVVVRPLGAASPTHAWVDRSSWLSPFLPMGWDAGVVYPLFGVSASGGYALITGQGGYIRESSDGGDSWTNAGVQGTSWRIQEAVFIDPLRGFLVGQHGRIARTTGGGFNWDHMDPGPGPDLPFLNGLAISPLNFGVAVGDTHAPGPNTDLPLIQRSDDVTVQSNAWAPASSLPLTAPDSRRLLDVTWAAANRFVAVGTGGLMLRSDDNGANWVTIAEPPNQDDFHSFDISGVAFGGADSGVFVGLKPAAGGALRGAAWANVSGVWSDITPPAPAGRHLARLSAVTIQGSTAWAVGETASNSNPADREGVVFFSTFSGGTFQAFADTGLVASLCTLGGDLLSPPPPAAILGAVAVAPNGDVFVGGACGRLYRRLVSTSTWDQIEVPSASHIRSLSIVSETGGGYGVFLGCFRRGEETQVILKY